MKRRPSHLPDYKKPPLNEVVLGVQFNHPVGYQGIRAGEVWALYKADYPSVEEQPPIAPSFETFGGRPTNILQFGFGPGATRDRFWFVSPSKDQLIQFQADRLLHNWRNVDDETKLYPRFEAMIEKFQAELRALEVYFATLTPQELTINQCEVSYINNIVLDKTPDVGAWLRILTLSDACRADDISVSMRRVLTDNDAKPLGRLIIEANSGFTPKGDQVLVLTLTVRGAPQGTTVADAIKFICNGRETIVSTFAEITTDSAQKLWERIQ